MELPSIVNALGANVFHDLRSEFEAGWLKHAFISPNDFREMCGNRSMIVLGESGTGKTAIRLMLMEDAQQDENCLCTTLKLSPLRLVNDSHLLSQFTEQLFDTIAYDLVVHFGANPQMTLREPKWAFETLRWFVQSYMIGERDIRLGAARSRMSPEGISYIDDLIGLNAPKVLPENSPYPLVISHLLEALQSVGILRVWVVVDGFETWIRAERASLDAALGQFLATLGFFEDPRCAFKIFVPNTLREVVTHTNAVLRRRLDTYELKWSPEQLIAIAEKRLSLATGDETFTLKCIIESEHFIEWLKKYGGDNPRGWLELLDPIIRHYLKRQPNKPFSTEDWTSFLSNHPPLLRIDDTTKQAYLGHYAVEHDNKRMSGKPLEILTYLYANRHRPCSKEELFFYVLENKQNIPERGEKEFREQKEYEGRIDNLIYRIRQYVEPDPGKPIYILTDSGTRIIRLAHVK
jgi:hypothetical protein